MKTIRFATAFIASSFLAATAAAAQTVPAQPKAVATPFAQPAPHQLARDTWSAADRSAVERKEADVAGAESRLADERGRLELMKYEARLRAGEKLSADDQQYLDSLRALFGKKK